MTTNAIPVSDADAVSMMLVYGGSFIVRLAACWQAADPVNRARLRVAFDDYFREYADLVRTTTR